MADRNSPPLSAGADGDPKFFVERERLVGQVQDWLSSDTAGRVAVLTGPPGSGKSRFAHWLSLRLASAESPQTLGMAILRDLRGDRSDDFSLNFSLNALSQSMEIARNLPAAGTATVSQRWFGKAVDSAVIGLQQLNLYQGNFVLWELRKIILPALASLPEGEPIVLIVDGLDEAYRTAPDFLEALDLLAERIVVAGNSRRGLGRLRLLLTSRPEIPVQLNRFMPPIEFDLADPAVWDESALTLHLRSLLEALDEESRAVTAHRIAEQSKGVWVIGVYCAQSLNEDVKNGKPVPDSIALPRTLSEVYAETFDRIKTRISAPSKNGIRLEWPAVRTVLSVVAAAQDAGGSLPRDVAAAALADQGGQLDAILKAAAAVLHLSSDGTLHFFHGDLGRWLVDGGLDPTLVLEGHELMTRTLREYGGADWSSASRFAKANVMRHALCAAELAFGSIAFNVHRKRCLDLLTQDRLAADPNPDAWLSQLARLSNLCPSGYSVPGTDVPLNGLVQRLRPILEMQVGEKIVRPLAAGQIDEFEALYDANDTRGALLWLQETSPRYRRTVADECRSLLAKVLAGWCPPVDAGQSAAAQAEFLTSEWRRTGDPRYISGAVEACRVALDLTPDEDTARTGRLIGLANALIDRIDTPAEQDDDLDTVIDLQRTITARPDLTRSANVWAVLGYQLRRRWRRDPERYGDDLTDAVAAYRAALDLTPDEDRVRTERLIGLANSLITRTGTPAEQDDDLDTVIGLQRTIIARPDLAQPGSARPAAVWAVLGDHLHFRWGRDPEHRGDDLTDAVAAYRAALDLTPDEDPSRTGRLIGLANALAARVDTPGEQDDDLDTLIGLQRTIIARPDLALPNPARPANVWAVLGYQLRRRWRRDPDRHADDLVDAVAAYRTALDLTPDEDPARTDWLIGLTNALISRVETPGEQDDDLDTVIGLQRTIIARPDLAHPASASAVLGYQLHRRWRRDPERHGDDLTDAVAAYRAALDLAPDEHRSRTEWLVGLANALIARVDTPGEQDDDLDTLIGLQRTIAGRPDLTHPASAWAVMGDHLYFRWRRDPDQHDDDLTDAVAAYRAALDLTPDEDPSRTEWLVGLANALIARIDTPGEQDDDLDTLIGLQRTIAGRPDLTHPATVLAVLGHQLRRRWRRDPDRYGDDLADAVAAYRAALDLTPDEDPSCTEWLIGLANALIARIDTPGEQDDDLDTLIGLQQAIIARPDLAQTDLTRSANVWAVLGYHLRRRWRRDPDRYGDDLADAVAAYRAALDLTPDEDPSRTEWLIGLANALAARVDTPGEQDDDLDTLIGLQQTIVGRPDLASPDPERPAAVWAALGGQLYRRWRRKVRPTAYDDSAAVAAYRAALDLTPDEDPARTGRLVGLANALIARMDTSAEQDDDLDTVIGLQRTIVGRPDLTHPASVWAVMGDHLHFRWRRDPDRHADDLTDSVAAYRAALDLTPDEDPARTGRLIGLANTLATAWLNERDDVELDEAIQTATEVLHRAASEEVLARLLPAIRYKARQRLLQHQFEARNRTTRSSV